MQGNSRSHCESDDELMKAIQSPLIIVTLKIVTLAQIVKPPFALTTIMSGDSNPKFWALFND